MKKGYKMYEVYESNFAKLKTIHDDILSRFEGWCQGVKFCGYGNGSYYSKFVFFADPNQFEQIKKYVKNNYNVVIV